MSTIFFGKLKVELKFANIVVTSILNCREYLDDVKYKVVDILKFTTELNKWFTKITYSVVHLVKILSSEYKILIMSEYIVTGET